MIIYKATNTVNGKVYIGQTRHSLETRKSRHLQCARKGVRTHFYQAIRKYGEDKFVWEILCSASNKKELNELETYFITKYDSVHHGYNMVDGGDNNIMDIESVKTKHDQVMQSDEVRAKISATMKKLRAERGFSEDTRKKISSKLKGNHNFGTGDTRSIGVYCVYDNIRYDFHSIKEAGKWWYETLKPFEHYSVCVYQRKIQQNIELGYCIYGREHKLINNIKWYRKEGDANETVTS